VELLQIAILLICIFAIFLFIVKQWFDRLEQKSGLSDEVVSWLKSSTVNFNARLDKSAYVIADLQKSIGEFSEIGRSMKDLQDFLQSPKLRGNIGEQILKDLLAQHFPTDSFSLQYAFKSGEKVDAIIRTSSGLIPIDAKFPLENFRKMLKGKNEQEKVLFKKDFVRDVKKHIQDISRKYIVTHEGTSDYALMYIPSDIFDKVDLGDPRDYLLGASGLVIKLPNGNFARAPYILPFVSTTARAGIPQEMEKEFAMKVLQASLEFYISAGERIGKPILLKNMDPNFVVLMSEMYGFDSNTTMESVVVWSMDNLDKIADLTESLGEFQEELAHLELPKNIIFIDVNGTLIPEGSIDGFISDEELLSLKKALLLAEEKGFSVGLCSDSPLPQLQEFAAKLGISGPIIAENGNLVFNNGESLILRILKSIEEIKIKILKLAEDHSYERIDDSIAPEYGGGIVDQNSPYWSFGANRETSVIVFGPPEFVKDLGVSFANNADYSVDVSSENNYFAIHPGSNFRDNKGMTLNTLSAHGHNIIMIGNSVSDWVVPTSGVQCAFVADSRITEEIVEKTAYISDKPLVSGVVDIIKSIK